MLEGEKVSFDIHLCLMVWWVYAIVNLVYVDVMPFMCIDGLWELRCYVEQLRYDMVIAC